MTEQREPGGLDPVLLEKARLAGDGHLEPARQRIARDRMEQALSRTGGSSTPRRLALLAAAALAVLVPVVRSRALTYSVRGVEVKPGSGYVSPSSSAPAAIEFSDGTVVSVDGYSTVRVSSAGLLGAALVQEQGSALYAVVHRPAAAWSVAAGPYLIKVTGTRFAVRWSPSSRDFSTDLLDGSVTVEGPGAEGGIQLRAGQRLRASSTGQLTIESLAASPPGSSLAASPPDSSLAASPPGSSLVASPPAGSSLPSVSPSGADPLSRPSLAPVLSAAGGVASGQEPPRPAGEVVAPAPRTLARRLADGEATSIAEEIEREGVESFTSRAPASDVVIAADAARLARRASLAQALFQALRTRHPGTREAALAAFQLGRTLDAGSPQQAIALYRAYLAETGGRGPLAQETRGRLLAAVARSSGPRAARPLAEEYLGLHPSGAHAALARSILEVHGE